MLVWLLNKMSQYSEKLVSQKRFQVLVDLGYLNNSIPLKNQQQVVEIKVPMTTCMQL